MLKHNRIEPYLLLLPVLLILTAVTAYPAYYAIDISLYATEFFRTRDFVGLLNYTRILGDQVFWMSVATSVKYTFGSLLITISSALALASLLNRKIRYLSTFRTLIVIPWTLSQSVVGML